MTHVYLVYIQQFLNSLERIDIGIYSTFELADSAAVRASNYWNADPDNPEYGFTIERMSVDEDPAYLGAKDAEETEEIVTCDRCGRRFLRKYNYCLCRG